MPHEDTLNHLTRLYEASDDPWNHWSSDYEAQKYAVTLQAIGPGPFRHALEIGCGNGALANLLADRCDHLTAMDCVPAAVASARRNLAHHPHVSVVQGVAPNDLPPVRPDLVLVSEVLYFLTRDEITALAHWLRAEVAGPVIAVNWTGPTDEPLTGPQAVDHLADMLGPARKMRHDGFDIDLFDPGQFR